MKLPSGECVIWNGARNRDGYGVTSREGRAVLAHRVAWEAVNGPVPSGLELDHGCRNPACINPDHLEAVTHAENVRRGRSTKLSAEQVAEIRELVADGATRAQLASIGRRFGVHPSTVSRIRCGSRWAAA